MQDLTTQHLKKDSNEQSQIHEVRTITFIGMIVNIVLTIGKMLIGLLCGSQALVADAIHSLSDLVTDVSVIVGVKYWAAPPN